MNKDELAAMLGMKPKQLKEVKQARIHDSRVYDIESLPESNTVITTDEWDKGIGIKLARTHNHQLREEFDNLEDNEKHSTMTDFFAAAFHQQPEVTNQCPNKVRQQFIETLLQTPDYQVLHESTKGNQFLAQKAATEFAVEYSKVLKSLPPDAKPLQQRIACSNAVARACNNLNEEVDNLQGFGLGVGSEPDINGQMDMEALSKSFQRVRNDPNLRRIFELAGRYRRSAQAKQRQKVVHGMDDLVGVQTAGDISRLLPIEMARLSCPELELDVMRRIVDDQAMCREYRGVEKVGKGPVVVCVDESGSMSGEPIAQAKAFVLAMAWIAKHQKRWIMLFNFTSGGSTRSCFLEPGKWGESELLEWLAAFRGGGTDLVVPLKIVPSFWDDMKSIPKGKTDMIIVTDAVVSVPTYLSIPYKEWKAKENVRTITIVIGHSPGQMGVVSEEVHCVSQVSVDSAAVDSCFSI